MWCIEVGWVEFQHNMLHIFRYFHLFWKIKAIQYQEKLTYLGGPQRKIFALQPKSIPTLQIYIFFWKILWCALHFDAHKILHYLCSYVLLQYIIWKKKRTIPEHKKILKIFEIQIHIVFCLLLIIACQGSKRNQYFQQDIRFCFSM